MYKHMGNFEAYDKTNWQHKMEFIESNKGGEKLSYKGHMYTRKKIINVYY